MPSQSSITNQKLYQSRLLLSLMSSCQGAEVKALEDGAVGHLYGAWCSYLLELAESYKKVVPTQGCDLVQLSQLLPGVQEVAEFEVLLEDKSSWLSRLLLSHSQQLSAAGHMPRRHIIGVDLDASVATWLGLFEQVIELQRENRQEF